MIYDVLIIGGGSTGSLSARYLSRFDLRIALAEAGPDVAYASTRANSAISHAGYDCHVGTLKAKLNVRGTELMPEICRELGVEYKRIGSHVVAFDEDDVNHLKELYERGIKNGVPGLRIIDKEELRAMEPNISEKAVASLWAPTAGIISPYGLTIAAAECAAVNGCDFFLNFPAEKIREENGVWHVTSGEKTLSARYIVNAAGVNAPMVAELAGEKDFPVDAKPSRGEYLVFDKQYSSMVNSTLFVTPSSKGKGILVSPTYAGNLITGPNANPVESSLNTETTANGLKEIELGGLRLIPNLPLRGVIKSFSGVRPNASRYDFYIEPSKQLPRLIHAAAISSPGLASSPAIAEYIAELLASIGLPLREKENFIPTRRKDGNPKRFADMTDAEKDKAIRKNAAYGRVICRCETVTEGDIEEAMNAPIPATTVDMLKHRLRAGMGRCQGGFCSPRVVELLARHQNVTFDKITKFGGNSFVVCPREDMLGRDPE